MGRPQPSSELSPDQRAFLAPYTDSRGTLKFPPGGSFFALAERFMANRPDIYRVQHISSYEAYMLEVMMSQEKIDELSEHIEERRYLSEIMYVFRDIIDGYKPHDFTHPPIVTGSLDVNYAKGGGGGNSGGGGELGDVLDFFGKLLDFSGSEEGSGTNANVAGSGPRGNPNVQLKTGDPLEINVEDDSALSRAQQWLTTMQGLRASHESWAGAFADASRTHVNLHLGEGADAIGHLSASASLGGGHLQEIREMMEGLALSRFGRFFSNIANTTASAVFGGDQAFGPVFTALGDLMIDATGTVQSSASSISSGGGSGSGSGSGGGGGSLSLTNQTSSSSTNTQTLVNELEGKPRGSSRKTAASAIAALGLAQLVSQNGGQMDINAVNSSLQVRSVNQEVELKVDPITGIISQPPNDGWGDVRSNEEIEQETEKQEKEKQEKGKQDSGYSRSDILRALSGVAVISGLLNDGFPVDQQEPIQVMFQENAPDISINWGQGQITPLLPDLALDGGNPGDGGGDSGDNPEPGRDNGGGVGGAGKWWKLWCIAKIARYIIKRRTAHIAGTKYLGPMPPVRCLLAWNIKREDVRQEMENQTKGINADDALPVTYNQMVEAEDYAENVLHDEGMSQRFAKRAKIIHEIDEII